MCKYRPDWHSLRHEGKLLPFAAPRIETLAFEVSMTTEVDISIYQPGSRFVCVFICMLCAPYVCLLVHVLASYICFH